MGDGVVTLAPPQHVMESVFSTKKPLMMRKGEGNCDKGWNLEEKTRGRELDRRKKGDLEKGQLQNAELELGEFIPEKPSREEPEVRWSRGEVEKEDSASDSKWKKGRKWELEKGEFVPEKKGAATSDQWGRWKVEKKSDRGRKLELEKGEFVPEKSRRGESNKGMHGPDHWGKLDGDKKGDEADKWSARGGRMELEKGEFVLENSSYRSKGEGDRLDFGPARGRKLELEKGEFIPENNSFRRKDGI